MPVVTTAENPSTPIGIARGRARDRPDSDTRFAVGIDRHDGRRLREDAPVSASAAEVREVTPRVPTVVVVHLEAINHCLETRAEVRAAVPEALVPEDGQTLVL